MMKIKFVYKIHIVKMIKFIKFNQTQQIYVLKNVPMVINTMKKVVIIIVLIHQNVKIIQHHIIKIEQKQ